MRIDLPWEKPELSPNKRLHWAVRARITRQRRDDAAWSVKASGLARQDGVLVVQLHYRPARRWHVDAGNLCLDLKAAVDGIVDAGIVPDDTPQFVRTPEPTIHPAEKGQPGSLWLVLTWVYPSEAEQS